MFLKGSLKMKASFKSVEANVIAGRWAPYKRKLVTKQSIFYFQKVSRFFLPTYYNGRAKCLCQSNFKQMNNDSDILVIEIS